MKGKIRKAIIEKGHKKKSPKNPDHQITSQSQKGVISSDWILDSHICSYQKWNPPIRESFSLENFSLDHHQVSQQMWGARSSSSVMSKCRFFSSSCDMKHVGKNSHCTLSTSVKHSSGRMVLHSMNLGSIKEMKNHHHREREKVIKKTCGEVDLIFSPIWRYTTCTAHHPLWSTPTSNWENVGGVS